MTAILALLFVLSLFPVSHVLVARWSRGRHARQAYGLACAAGVILLVSAARLPQPGLAATLGLLAGLALWSANGELGEAAGIGVQVGLRNWNLILLILLFALALALTAFLLPQQLSQGNWAGAVRLAVPTVIAGWSVIEILMKWGVVPKPWGGAKAADSA